MDLPGGQKNLLSSLIYLIILLLHELVLLLMQNPCFVHPRLQPLSAFSVHHCTVFRQRSITPVHVQNIYFLSSYYLRNLSMKVMDIYLDHLSGLAPFISTSNYSEPKIPTRRERPMSIMTREKKSSGCISGCLWLVVQLFCAKLFRNFSWS